MTPPIGVSQTLHELVLFNLCVVLGKLFTVKLIIVEGKGYYQERGKEVVILKKGDVIKCDKDVEHWHSSTPEHLVSYIAIYGNSETVWTEKLKKEDYDQIKIN